LKFTKSIFNQYKPAVFSWVSPRLIATILLFLFAFLIACIRFQIAKQSLAEPHSRSVQVWSQPTRLDKTHPVKISNRNWHFDFANIERRIWQSALVEGSDWQVNNTTLEILSILFTELSVEPISTYSKQAMEGFSEKLARDSEKTTLSSKMQLERLEFILSKSIPAKSANKLISLLKDYSCYIKLYNKHLLQVNQAKGHQKLDLLTASNNFVLQIQESCFGKVNAKMLFWRKNITTQYLTKRKLIQLDPKLNKEEKKRQLIRIKNEYTFEVKK
jgi:hypothetical protein